MGAGAHQPEHSRATSETSCSPWLTHSRSHCTWTTHGKANGPGSAEVQLRVSVRAKHNFRKFKCCWCGKTSKIQRSCTWQHCCSKGKGREIQKIRTYARRAGRDEGDHFQAGTQPVAAPTPQQGQKAAQDWEGGEEKCSSSREGSHRTAQLRPSSSKGDLSGLARYLEIRHQHCHLGRPKNVLALKRDRKETQVTESLFCNAIEQRQPGRVGSGWREQEGFGPERAQEVT